MAATFTALIVEDNPLAVSELVNQLDKTQLFDTPVVRNSVTEAFQYLNQKTTDILFLDLDLPDLPGLDLLKLFPSYPPVIITSLHVELAVACFDYEVADFLTKPFTYTRLLRAIHRATKQHTTTKNPPEINHIFLQAGRSTLRFNYSDILYMEAYGIYVKVATTNGQVVVNQMLSKIEENLPQLPFLRVHRSFLVNLNHLQRIESNDLWIGNHQVPIGVSYKDKVRQTLKNGGWLP